jgi:membrane dipeptidase
MTDDLMRAIARTGGVIGITCYGNFVSKTDATVTRFLDHVDHAVKIAGGDHVGVALDQIQYPPPQSGADADSGDDPFVSPISAYPKNYFSYTKGLESVAEMPTITEGLLQRGYSSGEVAKIMGENWLRVYEQVWGN